VVIQKKFDDGIAQVEAPFPKVDNHTLRIHCDANAEMIVPTGLRDRHNNMSVVAVETPGQEKNNSLTLKCKFENSKSTWNVDISVLRCRCSAGFIQGTGTKSSECVDCRDGTYAPLNEWGARSECRACPREGVDCTDGKLTILKDFWYDVNSTEEFDLSVGSGARRRRLGALSRFDSEGKQGLRPTTQMYKCMQRDACLLDKRTVPMKVKCHENHTGVLCARCYHRKVDCGRTKPDGSPGYQSCDSPSWLDGRGEDATWMYFAPLARHCTRCPSGKEAYVSYAITIAIGALAGVMIFGVVAHRLFNVWKRLQGKKRSKASGVARVFFNWMQMMSMLQAIKLQPPEEVSSAMETAEVVNISLEWFPIQCTLRLTFFNRVTIYMMLPLLAVTLPIFLVACCSNFTPCLRRLLANTKREKEKSKRCRTIRGWIIASASLVLGEDTADANASHLSLSTKSEIDALEEDYDALYNDMLALEALAEAGGDVKAKLETDKFNASPEKAAKLEASAKRVLQKHSSALSLHTAAQPRKWDAISNGSASRPKRRFFEVQGEMPIALRENPNHMARKTGLVVKPGDVVRARRVEIVSGRTKRHELITWVFISGKWGEGWIFDGLPTRKFWKISGELQPPLLMEINPATVVEGNDVEWYERNEISHCFRAIAAMVGVAHDVSAAAL
jgi:hypothetical protein